MMGRGHHNHAELVLVGIALSSAIAYLLNAGILRDDAVFGQDFQWFYIAGLTWLDGRSPYDVKAFEQAWTAGLGTDYVTSFMFPPTTILVSVPLAMMEWSTARLVFAITNLVVFLAGITAVAWHLLHLYGRSRLIQILLLLTLACLVSAVPGTIQIGQVGIIALSGAVGAIICWPHRLIWASALCVVAATMKPQLTLPALVYLAAIGGLRPLVYGALLSLLITVVVIAMSAGFDPGWLIEGHDRYTSLHFNRPANYAGIPAMFGETGFASAMTGGGALVAVLLALTVGRQAGATGNTNETDVKGRSTDHAFDGRIMQGLLLTFCLTAALMPVRQYDLVIYAPCFLLLVSLERRLPFVIGLVLLLLGARIGNAVGAIYQLVGGVPLFWLDGVITGTIALGMSILYWRASGQSSNIVRPGGF